MEKTSRVSMAALSNGPLTRHGKSEPPHHADRATTLDALRAIANSTARNHDHFVERDGMRFAGTHLIVDLWQASNLDDTEVVENALRSAAEAARATLLNIDLHCFTPNGGITGVAILAESHISIHTWPEYAYAAIDVFMCGRAEPLKAIDVFRRAFAPGMLTISEHKRGLMP
ncbi:MAG: adenosylmethionine decarboxylase [Variibacter sp.]|nr:adenosylmethionine decarboxylase [Variibacter sp.]